MRRLPAGTSFDVLGEVDHLRYQIARADALVHAADDLLERVGDDRQRREHVAHLVDLAKQATATALAMAAELARQLLKGRSEG
jgi:hypothetical protein